MITAIEKEPLEIGDLVHVYFDTLKEDYFAVKYVPKWHGSPSGIMMEHVEGEDGLVNIKQTGTISSRRVEHGQDQDDEHFVGGDSGTSGDSAGS